MLMIILFLILFVILSLIIWIIFVPVCLRIDTNIRRYEISQAGTVNVALHPGETPFITMRVLGIRIPVSSSTQTRKKKGPAKSRTKKARRFIKRSPQTWVYLIKGLLKSIRLKHMVCTVDFMDVVLNAELVPVMLLISRGSVRVSTNFTGQYYLDLEARGKVSVILWTFIRFLTKK